METKKKTWAKPEIILIGRQADVNSKTASTVFEQTVHVNPNFTITNATGKRFPILKSEAHS